LDFFLKECCHDSGPGSRTACGANQYGRGYNRNAAKLILAEVEFEHRVEAVAQLIRSLNLEQIFEFKPGMRFARK